MKQRNSGILRFCAARNSHSSSHTFSQFTQKKTDRNFVRYAFRYKKPFKVIAINEEISAKKKNCYQNKYVKMEIS